MEWIKRILEVPSDACILSLLTIVATAASSAETRNNLEYHILVYFCLVLISIVIYKYDASKVTNQGGQIQFDNFAMFVVTFVANIIVAGAGIIYISKLGIV